MSKEISPNYRVDWYRSPVDREVFREHTRKSDLRGFAQAGGHLALILATGIGTWLIYRAGGWGWMLPALFLHGLVSAFSINAVHELVHGTVFRTRRLNAIFANLFAFHGWINHHAFWASHTEHHKYTLHDPHDQEVMVPMEVTLRDLFGHLLISLQAFWWHVGHTFRLARGRPVTEWGEHLYGNKATRFRIYRWARILVAGHLAIAAVSLYYGQWLIPVLVSLTPAYRGGLQFLLNVTQHVGMQDHVSDFRLNSRSFQTNRLFRFLYWNMNYHIEHHMYPGVPCYRLPALHAAIRHDLPEPEKGLASLWFHIIGVLYRQKTEPGYVYVPALPAPAASDEARPRLGRRLRGELRAIRAQGHGQEPGQNLSTMLGSSS